MATFDITISRPGQINNAGAVDALNLKQFGGEVLTEFQRLTVFKDKHFTRTIQNAKAAQFPYIGKASAVYKTPGTSLDGQAIGGAEKVITIDGLLTSSVSIEDIEEAMMHFDLRGPYSEALGRALAYMYDANVARCTALSARAASPLTGRPGGTTIINASMKTDGQVLEDAIWTGAQTFDGNDIPTENRYGYFKPVQFNLLARRTNLLYVDYGGSGSIKDGTMDSVAGIKLVKTNQLPSVDDSANTGIFSKYRANYSTTAGLIATDMAAATVQLMGMSMESDYEIRNQGTFVVAKYAVGHDWLRPDCAIELKTA